MLDPQQRQDLAALQRYELRAAAADRRCDHGLTEITYKVSRRSATLTSDGG